MIALLLLLLLKVVATQLYDSDCPILQEPELGSFSSFSSVGLVPSVLNSVVSLSNDSLYQMGRYQVVCLAQGSGINLYRMISVIVSYHLENGPFLIGQFHFRCVRNEWNVLDDVSHSYYRPPLVGNLATQVKKNCRLCTDIDRSATPAEHCVGKVMKS